MPSIKVTDLPIIPFSNLNNEDTLLLLDAETSSSKQITLGDLADYTVNIVLPNSVDNTKLADMPSSTIKGRSSANIGDPEDLTAAQVKTILGITGADVALSGGGTVQDYIGFATWDAFKSWANGKTPAIGAIVYAEGVAYEYDAVSTIWAHMPGWKLATAHIPATATIYAPTVSITNVGDVLTDLKYNSMAGLGRKRDGALFAVWNGNDTPNISEGGVAQDIYMSDSLDNGSSFGTKYKPFKGVYASNPFTGVGSGWMQAVPLDFGGKSWVVWTCGRGSIDQGPMLSYRTNSLWTNSRLMQRTADGAIVARPELLNAAAPAGYTMLWNVDGADWFAYPQWMKTFDGIFYMGITLTHPTDGFSVAAKRSVVAYSTDGITFTLGEVMPLGVIQKAQAWEWDVLRLPNGSFRAYIRVNYNYVDSGDVGSTPSISYKFAMAESPDLLGWTSPTFVPLAAHLQRLTTTQMPNGFWGLALPDDSLSRNNQALIIIRDGGSIAAAVPVSNEVVATQWAHTGSAFYDSVTGKVMVIWSAGYNSGAFTAPSALRLSIIDSLPSNNTWNIIPQAREDEPAISGTIMSFSGTASAGIDLPLNNYTITFPANLIGSLTAAQTVVICSIGSAQAGLQIQYQGNRIEVVPVANGRAGSPIETLPDNQISVNVMPDHVVIGSERYWLAGSGEFHLGDYHETGSDLTNSYLSIDISKIRVSSGTYSNPVGDWWATPKPSVISNGTFTEDTTNNGAEYSLAVGVKLNDWRITANNGATGVISRGMYSIEEADAHGGTQTYMRIQCNTIGGTVDVAQRFAGANFLGGQLATLSVDLRNAAGTLIPVVVLWQQSFGTGGSTSIYTSLGTIFVDGSTQRQDLTFVIPEVATDSVFGPGHITQLIFRLPFDTTTADLRFSNVELSLGIGTAAPATSLIQPFDSATGGTVPASGGGDVNFLRADGLWETPIPAWSAVTSKPTTITGYGITDAVTINTSQSITGAKTFSTAPKSGTAITLSSTDDLNAITNSGWYYNSTALNTPGNNYPISSAGSLEVVYRSTTGGTQTYITYSGATPLPINMRIFVRSLGQAGWSAWDEVMMGDSIFSSVTNGVVPASGGGTVNFLRADGSWAGITGSTVALSGGGTAQDYVGFATRAAFVTWASGKTPAVGTVIEAGGLSYRYTGSGTAIADLPGWVPNKDITPDHWATNVPRVTDMTAAIQAAIDYVGDFPVGSQGRDPVLLMGREYLVTSTINITESFTILRGVASRNSLIVPNSDFGVVLRIAATDPTVSSIVEPQIEGIGFRVFFESSNSVAIEMVRAIGADINDVKVNHLSGGFYIQGGQNIGLTNADYTYGLYSAAMVPGTFAFKTREGPIAANKIPSNISLTDCDWRSEDQDNPRLDCCMDIGSCDGIFFSNHHMLGAIGKGELYLNPQVTALSPTGSFVTWFSGDCDFDGGSSYGIVFKSTPDGSGGYLTPSAYGGMKIKGTFSRQTVNHVLFETGSTANDVNIDGRFRYAGDSAIVISGSSHINLMGSVDGAGVNGTTGLKSAVVLNNDVHHIEINLQLKNSTSVTMTKGVEVTTNLVDYVNVNGSAWGVNAPIDDDYSFVSGTNTGSKTYKINSDRTMSYNVTVNSGAIQRVEYADTLFLDAADTSTITGAVRRFEGATFTAVVQSSRTFQHGTTTASLRLAGGVNWAAVSGDTITFRYSTLRGWVEIARTA